MMTKREMMTNPWQNITKPLNSNSYSAILVDKDSILKFYWAKDFKENKIFLLQLSKQVQKIKNIDELLGIKIVFENINDIQQLSFVLSDTSNDDIFYLICSDLLEKTKNIKDEQKAVEILLHRLDSWRKFLKSKKKILDKRGVIGLIGELYFLKNELFPKFGIIDSVNFWQAPLQEKQDFIIHDMAIEVKTRGTQNKITISSFEQLNSKLEKLYLYVITITESNIKIDGSINVTSFINELKRDIAKEDIELLLEFEKQLLAYGYVNSPIFEDFYLFIGESLIYKVIDDFPRIRKIDIGIEQLTYKINLDICKKFEVNNIQFKEQ